METALHEPGYVNTCPTELLTARPGGCLVPAAPHCPFRHTETRGSPAGEADATCGGVDAGGRNGETRGSAAGEADATCADEGRDSFVRGNHIPADVGGAEGRDSFVRGNHIPARHGSTDNIIFRILHHRSIRCETCDVAFRQFSVCTAVDFGHCSLRRLLGERYHTTKTDKRRDG